MLNSRKLKWRANDFTFIKPMAFVMTTLVLIWKIGGFQQQRLSSLHICARYVSICNHHDSAELTEKCWSACYVYLQVFISAVIKLNNSLFFLYSFKQEFIYYIHILYFNKFHELLNFDVMLLVNYLYVI